jgi:hypothetical protein
MTAKLPGNTLDRRFVNDRTRRNNGKATSDISSFGEVERNTEAAMSFELPNF